LYKWEGKEDAKNDLKSSSSLPLHAQGRRRTVPFKTTLFQCFVVFFFLKRNVIWKKKIESNPKMGYDSDDVESTQVDSVFFMFF
jgi:hypothetical protein